MIVVCKSLIPLHRTIEKSPWQVQTFRNAKLAFLRLTPVHAFILSIYSLFLHVITPAGAVLVNVTVDDQSPDPLTGRLLEYQPDDRWGIGQNCTTCSARPDAGMMFDGTWHDTTYFPASSNAPPSGPQYITFTFNGTSIYVFCALALTLNGPTGFSNMSFFIDDELVGQFERVPPNTPGYLYNVSVYSNDSLPAGEHTFMLQNGQLGNLGNKSLVLFDYLVYSYDDGLPAGFSPFTSTSASVSSTTAANPPSDSAVPTSALSAGALAGIAMGGIAGIAFTALLIWFLFIRRSRNEHLRAVNKRYPTTPPFTAPRMTTSPTPYPIIYTMPAVQYGVGVNKSRSTEQLYIPSNSTQPSSSLDPPTSGGPQPSPVVHQEERDAGPVVLDEEDARTLPPTYRYSIGTTIPL